MARHALARGRVGWEPYPTSLRLVNWCAFFFGRHAAATAADAAFRSALWRSVALQVAWLRRHLETHLLGNHLLENAVALAFCGGCFEGEAARAWRRAGCGLLTRELAEQVLPDGGHFERSPMYHQRVAWCLAALLHTGDAELRERVEEPLARMLPALEHLRHPDGGIALLNDSAFGMGCDPAALLAWGSRLAGSPAPGAAPGPFALPDTGYYGARTRSGHYLICDAAPIGPDHLPGHAHADLLSFELSLGGRRVVCDAGVFGYEDDALRAFCRSTRAHNTVEVAGADQCELWGVFRVARRGRPRDVTWERTPDGFRLAAWHDGYERLRGRPRHWRELTWRERGVLLVRDRVSSAAAVGVASRLHLHPECEIADLDARSARIRHPGGALQVAFAGHGRLAVEPSSYCPEFGVRLDNPALVFSAEGSALEMGFCIADGWHEDARTLSDALLRP